MDLIWIIAEVSGVLLILSLVFGCLKIKSSKKDPEFAGIAGTLVHKDPDEEGDEHPGRKLPEPPDDKDTPSNNDDNNNKDDGELDEEEEESSSSYNRIISEHPYAKVRKTIDSGSDPHPYAKVRKKILALDRNHEYATLKESTMDEESSSSSSSTRDVPDSSASKAVTLPTYATVSETTSEDTYAAIEDPTYNKLRNNSNTYAVIGMNYPSEDGNNNVKRPSVDESGYTRVNKSKKKDIVRESLSRTSSPPLPPVDESGYTRVDKSVKRPVLEDMYAKVNKRHDDDEESLNAVISFSPSSSRAYRGYEFVRKPRIGPRFTDADEEDESSDGYEILRGKILGAPNLSRKDSANYEILPDRLTRQDSSSGGYETVSEEKKDRWRHRNYDKAQGGYESIQPSFEHMYDTAAGEKSDTGEEKTIRKKSDPPYTELIKSKDEEEGYETIPRSSGMPNAEYDPMYEIVSKAMSEPAYETIESKAQAPSFRDPLSSDEEERQQPGSLIHMSVQESDISSPDSHRRASVVVIEHLDAAEDVVDEDNGEEKTKDVHVFV